jgi:hypothetical protein
MAIRGIPGATVTIQPNEAQLSTLIEKEFFRG